ncbi:hypothetical protein ACQ3G6_00815 [Allorhizobium undicola]|uniref:hypothetical protein n=1 Tax=Allorhizobium undicola TaxID=78527 RepID=UPI0004878CC0|nr:hypothetical protein [Allorhizobium undicola]
MNEYVSQRSLLQSSPRFTIGRDQKGFWVLQDETNRLGGLFASEEAALKFVSKECKDHSAEISRAPATMTVELAFNNKGLSRAA